jgi:uncharacterized protein YndB with AHSA1/START domain
MKCFGLRRAEVDLRVGGEWLWDEPGGPIGGVFRDVEAPGRLVFTLQKADGHEPAVGEAVVTLTFRPAADGVGTEVFLTHQNVHLPEQAASHAGWWTERLAALERYAAGEDRP